MKNMEMKTQQMNEKDWAKWVWEIYGWVGNEI
jgi:hypothetical protein